MKTTWKCTSNGRLVIGWALWLHVLPGLAQRPNPYLPSAVRVGADLIGVGTYVADRDRLRFELSSDVDLRQYFASFDYGYARTNQSGTDFSYQNQGSYFRIGPDVNLLPADAFGNVIFFGVRYARSFFSDQLSFTQDTPPYGTNSFSERNNGLRAAWGEATFGTKIQVAGQVFIGFTGRYKFAMGTRGAGGLAPYEIPGFGKFASNGGFGLNYFIYYRFKFREKPPIIRSPKKKAPAES